MRTIIFILGGSSLPLARKIADSLQAEIHAPAGVDGGTVRFEKALPHLQGLFRRGYAVIGICAAGILVRALAGVAENKHSEPPVVAVSEDGAFAVPLLGGHHGANGLAKKIASVTGGHAAVTTASDVALGVSLDEPAEGYALGTPDQMKSATMQLLQGEKLRIIEGEADWLDPVTDSNGAISAAVTIKIPKPDVLTYHPKSLVIGIGCERGTEKQEVEMLIAETLAEYGLSAKSIAAFATIDLKEDEAAFVQIEPMRYFSAEELKRQSARVLNPSDIVLDEVGTPSVAEAAALAAAGADAKLIVPKSKSKRATVAIAQAPYPLLEVAGKTRGRLHVIGLGPGTHLFRSPAVSTVLDSTTDWVGYGLYLDLAKDQHTDQILHEFPLGGEEDRCRHAIALAKQGKRVALLCSGDAAIYAMAALVYELIDREPCRIAVEVQPGISAFQLASAKSGALIGHDFCCISLSDLLTPWDTITQRVKAAAEGDFVVAFYNPRSLKRTDQISKAFDILRPHRAEDAPVVLASNLGRPEEKIRVLRFSEFNPEDVDMLTLVLVGSSQSRMIKRGDGENYAYTPRGYAKKMEPLT